MIAVVQEAESAREALAAAAGAVGTVCAVTAGIALLLGLQLLTLAVMPEITGRAATSLRSRPVLSFVVGILFVIGLFGCAHVFRGAPPLMLIPLSLGALGLTLSLSVVSECTGHKLSLLIGRERSRVAEVLSGWPVFSLAALVPFLGWFVIAPIGIVFGLGAAVLAFFPHESA